MNSATSPKIPSGQGQFSETTTGPFYHVTTSDFVKNKNECENYIAKGSFGYVYKTTFKLSERCMAVKNLKIKQSEDKVTEKEHWSRELDFLTKCSGHDHIVWLHGFMFLKQPSLLQLFLELMTCSFREILSTFNCHNNKINRDTPFKKDNVIASQEVAAFLKQTSSGLTFLHGQSLMHRDIKPGNILLKVDSAYALVKLGDFGSIKDERDVSERRRSHSYNPGTTIYGAPEVFGDSDSDPISSSCDIWSLAISTLYLITGYHPILNLEESFCDNTSASTEDVYQRNLFKDDQTFSDIPSELGLSTALAETLGTCLEKDPKKRPTATNILQIMSLNFIEDRGDRQVLFKWFEDLNIIDDLELKRKETYELHH